jgi:hypothetical protein
MLHQVKQEARVARASPKTLLFNGATSNNFTGSSESV